PAEPWSVEELAKRAGMSRSGFAARFNELLGEAPGQYLTRWRIQLASQRLRDTDESIASVAAKVGYGSESAFSRAFKREAGRGPADFRKALQKG
ncbi:MAG: helix-turn-helix transcriptional regulator, partial [Myxococcales bacterium]|nr:helix-turn-helix transcriptional regulator [Myxococcales bacterium]